MGKKITTSTKPAAQIKAAAKPSVKKQPAKATLAAAKPTKAAAKPAAAKAPAFTQDDIALRAYYIGEKRRHLRLPGDESHDWIEAERQLLAESKPARKKSVTK